MCYNKPTLETYYVSCPARCGNMFCSVTIVNYFYDQLMGLFEFSEEVFVSKIAIYTEKISLSLHVFECL